MTTITTIEQAKAFQVAYRPNQQVAQTIQEKNIVMFVAPAACGKTFIMNQVAALDKRFRRIPTFTTREARPDDDPDMFRYLLHDDTHIRMLLDKISRGDIVQYVVHPSGRFYGSEVADYPTEYNMLATLSFIVEPLRRLPFKHAFVIGIVTDVVAWELWFSERFPKKHPERVKRLEEAIHSLEWLLAHQHDESFIWAYNQPGASKTTAQGIIDAILYNKRDSDAATHATAILNRAREML